jgi:hypothetical protein
MGSIFFVVICLIFPCNPPSSSSLAVAFEVLLVSCCGSSTRGNSRARAQLQASGIEIQIKAVCED